MNNLGQSASEQENPQSQSFLPQPIDDHNESGQTASEEAPEPPRIGRAAPRNRQHRRPLQRMTPFERRYKNAVSLQMQQIRLQQAILERIEGIPQLLDINARMNRIEDRQNQQVELLNQILSKFPSMNNLT